mgnify:CR=1 FL=1
MLETVEAGGHRQRLGRCCGELVEVCAEQCVVGSSGPLGGPVELTAREGCDLAVHVQAGAVAGRLGESEAHESVQRVHQPAAVTDAGSEPEGA